MEGRQDEEILSHGCSIEPMLSLSSLQVERSKTLETCPHLSCSPATRDWMPENAFLCVPAARIGLFLFFSMFWLHVAAPALQDAEVAEAAAEPAKEDAQDPLHDASCILLARAAMLLVRASAIVPCCGLELGICCSTCGARQDAPSAIVAWPGDAMNVSVDSLTITVAGGRRLLSDVTRQE